MSSRLVSIWGAAALLTSSIAADAASITNRDDQEQKITITEGEATTTEHTLKPAQVLDNVCMKGCIIRFNGSEDDEYEVEGTDVVSIEEGFLYYDGPDEPQAPASGPATPIPPGGLAPPTPQPKQ
jgi:hypothetical protein